MGNCLRSSEPGHPHDLETKAAFRQNLWLLLSVGLLRPQGELWSFLSNEKAEKGVFQTKYL